MAQSTCQYCGNSYANENGLNLHVRKGCKSQAKRMHASLEAFQTSDRPEKRRYLPPLDPIGSTIVSVAGLSQDDTDTNVAMDVHEPASELPTPSDIHGGSANENEMGSNNGGRPVRNRRPNTRYKDYVDSTEEQNAIELLDQPVYEDPTYQSELTIPTKYDTFGLRRCYYETPNHNPSKANDDSSEVEPSEQSPSYGPLKNYSEFLLSEWFTKHPSNTVKSFTALKVVLDDPQFNPKELPSANMMLSRLANVGAIGESETLPDWMDGDASWIKSSVTIQVPFAYNKATRAVDSLPHFGKPGLGDGTLPPKPRPSLTGGPKEFTVHNFYHRSLTSIIREKLSHRSFQEMHIHPYDLRWKPSLDKEEVRVYGEMYTSQQFLSEHIKIQNSVPRPHQYPRVLLAIVIYSDSTKLANFGHASLWPGYMQFGNDTKYARAMSSAHKTEHFAYFQKLPPEFKTFLRAHNGGKKVISHLLTHCRRELFHAQWELILDDDFLEAYEHGLKVNCYDGLWRLFLPRIFVYSADYPEKVLLATIKYLTRYLCPRCLITMENVPQLGTTEDMETRTMVRTDNKRRQARIHTARQLVYEKGRSLNSKLLEPLLSEGSYTITENAFSKRLSKFGFNVFSMFRTEILHEWSSNGEGKKVHIHLLRILDTVPDKLSELDERYRAIPSFGKDAIRKFHVNVSEKSFQAGRDIEDIIFCALPAYEGLLPEPNNEKILDLLFAMGEWHSLAKMRLHTDHTLRLLDKALEVLGASLRYFVDVICPQFKTLELKHEAAKRARRKLAENRKAPSGSSSTNIDSSVAKAHASSKGKGKEKEVEYESTNDSFVERRETVVSLNTSKLHALGDVASSIRDVGTTDSYSAEMGESEHRIGKRRYPRTDGRDYTKQLAQHDRREARLRHIRERLDHQNKEQSASHIEELSSDPNLLLHYQIGVSQNNSVKIVHFISKHQGDPAVRHFMPKLRKHLLPRIKSMLCEEYRAKLDSEIGSAGTEQTRRLSPLAVACSLKPLLQPGKLFD